MANDLSAIVNTIFARGLSALRSQAIMARAVNTNWSTETAEQGKTINVPIPAIISAVAVTPSSIAVVPSSLTPTVKPITLDTWQRANFTMTDKEQVQVMDKAGYVPMHMSSAIEALARKINSDLFALYYQVYNAVGVAGTAPFPIGSGNFPTPVGEPADVNKVLNTTKTPLSNRRLVLDPVGYAAAQKHPNIAMWDATGDQGPAIEGSIGRKFGLDWYFDQQAPLHTAGTITTGLAAKASTAVSAGATSFVATTAASTGACALKKGDLISIAGQTQTTFALQADATQASAASDVTLTVLPALDTALAGGEAVTLATGVSATHRVNLGFHRDAFAFANRPVSMNQFSGGNIIRSAADPDTGIALTLEVSRQDKQTVWDFSVLYGVAVIRPEMAVRLVG
jgi:P22 coat protein - gene protein 5